MHNVTQFPKTPADEALRILEQAWAYYTPTDKPVQNGASQETGAIIPYYQAA